MFFPLPPPFRWLVVLLISSVCTLVLWWIVCGPPSLVLHFCIEGLGFLNLIGVSVPTQPLILSPSSGSGVWSWGRDLCQAPSVLSAFAHMHTLCLTDCGTVWLGLILQSSLQGCKAVRSASLPKGADGRKRTRASLERLVLQHILASACYDIISLIHTRLARSLGNLNVVASDQDWAEHGGYRVIDNAANQMSNLNAINANHQLQPSSQEVGPDSPSHFSLGGSGLSLSHSRRAAASSPLASLTLSLPGLREAQENLLSQTLCGSGTEVSMLSAVRSMGWWWGGRGVNTSHPTAVKLYSLAGERYVSLTAVSLSSSVTPYLKPEFHSSGTEQLIAERSSGSSQSPKPPCALPASSDQGGKVLWVVWVWRLDLVRREKNRAGLPKGMGVITLLFPTQH
ncbi:hypothetical protein JZ751_006591 [Albula glossodonta]|uniref:Uncharacterized protein n=1 Tax=Albula glossodonta TaxID=121402 RepID=A0A8T2N3X8_9TELE|nr:hypothetical protein JZ751_006591 [Albula glossodonta]